MQDPDRNLKELQGRFRDIRKRHERGDRLRHAKRLFKRWVMPVALLICLGAAAWCYGPEMLREWLPD